MGYLTVVCLRNDAMGRFESDPKAFGEAILKGMHETEMSFQPVTVPVGNYANPLEVFPPRHADHNCIYVLMGNTLTELDDRLAKRNPNFFHAVLQTAKNIIDWAKQYKKEDAKTLPSCPNCNGETEMSGKAGHFTCYFCGHSFAR